MARCVWPHAALAVLPIFFTGCSTVERAQRPAWREQAEKACIAEHRVTLSRYIQPRGREIDGPGICGLTHPFMVGALSQERVQLDTVATLDCPMIAALDEWIDGVVQPVAQARFGQPITQIDTMGSYSCRGMNGQANARISEHAFGNAIDIGGFRLADGRRITVVHDWTRGDEQTQAFLRDVHAGACKTFTTVLGPGANVFHYNHIHVDLAMHGGSSRGLRHICKPIPDASVPAPRIDNLPDPPTVDEEQDVASASHGGGRAFAAGAGEGGLNAGAPPAYEGHMPSRSASYSPVPGSLYRKSGNTEGAGNPNDWDITSSIPSR